MKYETERVGHALVIKLFGEIDQHCVKELRDEIDRETVLKNPSTLIIDLGGVEFMDSSGLGLIMGRYKNMVSRGGTLMLIRPRPNVDKLLELSGIKTLLKNDSGIRGEKYE